MALAGKQRRNAANGPYLLVDSTLDQCLRELMAKPTSTRHLYEIHTAPRPQWQMPSCPRALIVELARQRGLDRTT